MTNFLCKKFIKDSENTANPAVRASFGSFAGKVGIILNLFLFLIKIFMGTLSGSISIIADAINNLSDCASSLISLIGFKLSKKPADRQHPFGHGRYEYLAALSVAVIIVVAGFELLKASVKKIIYPQGVFFSPLTILILIASILIKLWLSVFYKTISKKIDSGTLLAASADSRNDFITTAAVLISLILSKIISFNLDGYFSAGVAIFIMYSGFSLIRGTVSPILGDAPNEETVSYIYSRINSYPGVLGSHDLIIHNYGPGKIFASVHVEVDAAEKTLASHNIVDKIEKDFFNEENINMIIHADPRI